MKAPAYQHYAADFQMDTMGWPLDRKGALVTLMDYQWINNGVPDDLRLIAGILGVSGKTFERIWLAIEFKFPICADAKRRNPRMEEERHKQQEYRKKQSDAAAMRWHKTAIPQKDALQSSSSTTPVNQKQKQEPTARATRLPELFRVTPDHRYFAKVNDLPSPDDHIAEFRDYWMGKAGANAKKLDWDATFRNWLRKAKEFKGRANGERKAQPNKATERFNSNVEAIARGFGLGDRNGDGTNGGELAEFQHLPGNGGSLEGGVAADRRPIRLLDAPGNGDAVHSGTGRLPPDSGKDS